MIRFRRDGQAVRCDVEIDVPQFQNRTLYFRWETGHDIFAGLLSEELQNQMQAKLTKIRQEGYEQGWKDAKAKTVKRAFFGFGWRTNG